jgi:hypothetical protein
MWPEVFIIKYIPISVFCRKCRAILRYILCCKAVRFKLRRCVRRAYRTPPPAFACALIGPRDTSGTSPRQMTHTHPPTAALALRIRKSSRLRRPCPCTQGGVPLLAIEPSAARSCFSPLHFPIRSIPRAPRIRPPLRRARAARRPRLLAHVPEVVRGVHGRAGGRTQACAGGGTRLAVDGGPVHVQPR